MKRASFVVAVPLALGLVVTASSVASAQDPRLGSWKLDLAKSKYNPGPPPKSDTRTFEADGDGVKATIKQVPATGEATTVAYTAKLDGKDYPVTGSPTFDTIALKRINTSTIDATLKKNGKVVQTTKNVVSKKGKEMTSTAKGTSPSGQPFNNRLVFDKQ